MGNRAIEYAVYRDGVNDNDEMDWFVSFDAAICTASKCAENLDEGQSIYMSKVEDGIFEDFPLEFRKDNGIVIQFRAGKRLWS